MLTLACAAKTSIRSRPRLQNLELPSLKASVTREKSLDGTRQPTREPPRRRKRTQTAIYLWGLLVEGFLYQGEAYFSRSVARVAPL